MPLHLHRHILISFSLADQFLRFRAVPSHRRRNHQILSNTIYLLLDKIQLVVLLELLQTLLIEVLTGLHEILLKGNLVTAEVAIALQMLVEFLGSGGNIVHSEVDDGDGEIALEPSNEMSERGRMYTLWSCWSFWNTSIMRRRRVMADWNLDTLEIGLTGKWKIHLCHAYLPMRRSRFSVLLNVSTAKS